MEKPSVIRRLSHILAAALWGVVALAGVLLGIVGYQLAQFRRWPEAGEALLAIVLVIILSAAITAATTLRRWMNRHS